MGILDKIFRKKSEVQAGEQSKTTVSQPVPVDDKPLPIVNDLVMPKNLHSATRMIVDKHGDVFLEQKAFVNMLNDYQLLRECLVRTVT